MRLLALGRLSTLGIETAVIPSDVTDSDTLRNYLGERWPELLGPRILMAVNQTLVRRSIELGPDDEVAFLPPMSGG